MLVEGMNTSQDPDYVGPTFHEKKFHQTHFQGVMERPTHPRDDPEWEYVGMGRWRRKPRRGARYAQEVGDV